MLRDVFEKYLTPKNAMSLLFLIIVGFFLCKNIDISIMLFTSIIFACALNPFVDKLTLKKVKRPLATTIVLSIFFIIVAIFILPILYLATYQIVEFAKDFPQYITNLDNIVSHIPLLKKLGMINISSISTAFATSSSNIFDNIMNFISEISSALLYIFTGIILLFFFLLDKDKIINSVLRIFPYAQRQYANKLILTVGDKLSGYVFAQTIVSGSVWVTMTIGLLIFKIHYAFLLGLIAGVLSIIPVVGSAISLVICLIATYEMGFKYLIIVTILYTISHFVENHIVRPYVYSKFLNLHQVIIFLALIIGAKFQGVLGVILAPPFAMALYIILEELYLKKMDEQL